jgi:nitrate reductase NapE component
MFTAGIIVAILEAVTCVSVLALCICAMLAIGCDCKAHNVSSRKAYMVLAFFFPIVVGIIYLCKRNKYKKACEGVEIPNSEKEKKNAKAYLIVAIIAWIICIIATVGNYYFIYADTFDDADLPDYTESGEQIIGGADEETNIIVTDGTTEATTEATTKAETTTAGWVEDEGNMDDVVSDYGIHYTYKVNGDYVCYDVNGKSYTNSSLVPYYDKSGNKYTYNRDEDNLEYLTDSNGTQYSFYNCYVDENGYFVYDADLELTSTDYLTYYDENSNKYFKASDISWNANGKLVDSNGTVLN